ncbi:hypothetical protein HK096_000842 [Nowakowskiella sp. JEL0078]|nr:hypothetical protein HK096_000842 [Nowakowskiella sp. JEL0078]
MHFDATQALSIDAHLHSTQLWDLHTGSPLSKLVGHHGPITAVHFESAKSPFVVTGGVDRTVRVWKAGLCVEVWDGHLEEVGCLRVEGEFVVSGSEDGTVRGCRAVLGGHLGAVCCVDYRSGWICSGSTDQTIKIWNSEFKCVSTLKGHFGDIYCIQFEETPQPSQVISGSQDASIKIWELNSGKCVKTLRGHQLAVVCLQFDLHKIVSGSADKTIKVWDRVTGACLYTLQRHASAVWSLKFTESRIISSSFDQSLLVWDFAFDEIAECVNFEVREVVKKE